jgi:chromosome segregation ATPase
VAKTLDSDLKERLRAVLGDRRVTEADLRRLAEEGRACALILRAQVAKREQALTALSSDPASSLSEIADALRDVNQLRPDLTELEALLGELQGRAREFRLAWVSATSGTH